MHRALLSQITRRKVSTFRHGFLRYKESSNWMVCREFSAQPSEDTANVDSNRLYIEESLKPSEVVKELDRHIVGQAEAKKAVAIALRNRWRRKRLPEKIQKEITPRNVLMIGPTGCGKTEIARRMANLDDSPFLKVEATKFTEVGYHGRDVDSIIRDLMDVSYQLTKKVHMERVRATALKRVESKILDILMGPANSANEEDEEVGPTAGVKNMTEDFKRIKNNTRERFTSLYRSGGLDDQEITVEIPAEYLKTDKGQVFAMGNMFPGNNDGSTPQHVTNLMNLFKPGKENKKRKKMKISEAKTILEEVEIDTLLEDVDLKAESVQRAEESGIVFLDEIDKICSPKDSYRSGADASAEGVQRDLLPLVEGTVINTKYGNVKTDYILFIGSGAFHQCKPSEMLPELQGRLPIRVELSELTEDDLYKILTEPETNLVRQQKELLNTEGVTLVVEEEALREIARVAALLNRTVENIGARRLHTVLERIMEDISYDSAEMEEGSEVSVTKDLISERLDAFMKNPDLSRYIL